MLPVLFSDPDLMAPPTEGIKYAGSKLRLLPYLLRLAQKVSAQCIFDGFSGTTRVSQAFAKMGYQVIANDCAVWSKVFGLCYLKNKQSRSYYQELIHHLNALPEKEGWFTEHYGGIANSEKSSRLNGLKKPWQMHNTRKLDAIREELEILNLDEISQAVILTSLMLALDQVDNTLGHFAAYLNEWSPRSYHKMKLVVPQLIESNQEHAVYCDDVFTTMSQIKADLAYYDPPYGSNNEKMPPSRIRYAAYYHLWSTVCLNDRPTLFGKANRRLDSSDRVTGSVFESFKKNETGKFIAVAAIERLLNNTPARYIILSYNSCGRATAAQLYEIIGHSGTLLAVEKLDYRRNVMATMRWTKEWIREAEDKHYEYLFLIEK